MGEVGGREAGEGKKSEGNQADGYEVSEGWGIPVGSQVCL